ncbi:MAG: OmpA family protein [Sumerlaeia bacterium]
MHKRSLLALYTAATTLSLLAITGCNTVQKGAAAGGALGAGAGAIIGNGIPEGTVLGGALIGGAAGTATGGLVGDQFAAVTEKDMERELQNLRAQLAAKEAELAALQNAAPSDQTLAELSNLRSELANAQQKLDVANGELDKARQFQMNGTSELSSLRQDLANEKGRATTLQNELKLSKDQLAQANNQRDSYETQLAAANTELNKLRNDLQTIEATLKEKSAAVDGLRSELSKLNIELEETSRGLQLTIVDQLLFKPGQAQLSDTGVELLSKVAEIIKTRFPERELMIEGHTDNVPIVHSGWRSNWELGAGRALTVVHELIDFHGFKPSQLSATTFGEFRPTTSNTTENGRAENRRSVITILPEKAPIKRTQIADANL